MALIQCDFSSRVLGLSCSMNVILPQPRSEAGDRLDPPTDGYPTLWLLHGLSDDHTTWQRRTSIERYAVSRGLAVVMPAVGRSFYTDMHAGPAYWTFISEELPAIARSFFPLSSRREDNFAAGLSMGGYGAFKLALRHPERFAAAASLSGVLDIAARALRKDIEPAWEHELQSIFGDLTSLPGSDNDLMHLAAQLATRDAPRPALYQCCGTADFLYPVNLTFRDHARRVGLELTYEEHADQAHTWDYWDMTIQRVLDWLPLHQHEASVP